MNFGFSKASETPADTTATPADTSKGDLLKDSLKLGVNMRYDASVRIVHLDKVSAWNVFDLKGVLVSKGYGDRVDLNDLHHGTYIVRVGVNTIKVR